MKKIALSIVAVLALSFSLLAQPSDKQHKGAKPGMQKHGKMGMKELNLTDAQKQQLKQQHESFKKQMDALNTNDKITMGDYRKQKAALQAGRKQQFENILTADQKAKLADQKNKMAKMREQRGEQHLAKMKEKLNLSDAQVTQLKGQQQTMQAKLKAIHDNTTLSNDQKKEQSKALMAERKTSFEKVLTAEQLEKMKSFKQNKNDKEGKK